MYSAPKQKKLLFGAFFFGVFFITSLFSSTLHLSIAGNPGRLNPLLATDSTSSEIVSKIFAGLLTYDKNGKIIGEIAEKYWFENDTTLYIDLRKDFTWHDGYPVTADDVVFTYQTAISPKIFTPYSSSFRVVKNVEAIGKYRVKITYKKPYFKALEVWLTNLIPKHILQNDPDLMSSEFNKKPLGNGMYKLSKLEFGKDIEFIAYDKYKPHKAKIDKTILHYTQDPMAEFLMLKSKKLDMGGLKPIQIERQLNDDFKNYYRIIETPAFAYTYLGFNLKREKFKDKRVREALNYALDRQEMVDILFFGHGTICNGPFLQGSVGYNENVKSPMQDLKKARVLLKEAGYDEGHPFSFELATNSNNDIRLNAAQIIQYQLAKIGVKVKIRSMEWQAFLNRVVHSRSFDTVLMGWALPLMPDPYNVWHSDADKKGGFNFIGYKNEKVDKLIVDSESIVNRQKLDKNFQKIFQMIVEDYPYLFLYIPNDITVINKKIQPIDPTFLGIGHNRLEWEFKE